MDLSCNYSPIPVSNEQRVCCSRPICIVLLVNAICILQHWPEDIEGCLKWFYINTGVNSAVINVSAFHARGPRFESQRLHSSLSLKTSAFVPVASRGFSWNGAGEN